MPLRAIHATAVAIGGEALLICGPSRAGKSRLALALIARSARARPIELVGDDRIVLARRDGRWTAAPHPRIAGFVERRGLGIVAMDWLAEATVGGIVELSGAAPPSPACGRRRPDEVGSDEGTWRFGWDRGRSGEEKAGLRLPVPILDLACAGDAGAYAGQVLAWWAARGAAGASHLPVKAHVADP